MRKTKGKWALLAGGICMFATAMMVVPSTTKAASAGITRVDEDAEYTDFDLDGDGEKDSFYIETSYGSEDECDYTGTLKVYVNDKKVFSQKRDYHPYYGVQLITLENGKTFIDIESSVSSDDDIIHKLYRCKSDKLSAVYDFQKDCENYSDSYWTTIKKVSGNSLQLSCGAQFHATGIMGWNMKVNYTNGAFKRAGSSYDINYKSSERKNKWTAQRTMRAYKKAGGKKLAYKIKKGEKVKIYNVVIKNNKVYFKVKNRSGKGKTAYLTATKKSVWPSYFKEAFFAG